MATDPISNGKNHIVIIIALTGFFSHFLRMRYLALLLLLIPGISFAAITATDIRYSDRAEEVIFQANKAMAIKKSFILNSPPRLVIDIPHQPNGKDVGLSSRYSGRLLQNIRFGQFNDSTSRLVLDLTTANITYQAHVEGHSLKILLSGNSSQPPARRAKRPPMAVTHFPLPQPKPQHLAKDARKPVIVIDAGHGGKDSGAIGRKGTIEKKVTLKYTQELRKELLKTGRYRVALTRNGDNYLFLKERVNVARKQQGDAFLSIHADSNPSSNARGLSVYTLSEKASDKEAAALARQENKADIVGGMDLSVEDETVANILIDLAQRETNNKSSKLAEYIISTMKKKVPLITNPHRQAGFRVLKSPDIPSVLLEVGFLTNKEDEKRVNDRNHRAKVTKNIIKALDRFFYSEK